jgi:glutamate carboxypeptidase
MNCKAAVMTMLVALPIFGASQGPAQETTSNAAPVSVEEIVMRHVDEEYGRAIELLEKSVNINSGTMNLEGVRQTGELYAAEFAALGFDVEWIDGAPFARAGHLLATRERRGPKILLIGHLDTVFDTHSPFQEFEKVDEYSARGPGTTDMKGGNVVMIQALRALDAAGVLDDISVKVVLTGDEELQGSPRELRIEALVRAAIWADVAIGFEDGDSNPATAVISRRGTSGWKLEVGGKPNHSSQVFQPGYGYGAIFEAARILTAFQEALSSEPNLSFNPGMIAGGTEVVRDDAASAASAYGKSNVIAETAYVRGDLRTISIEQRENVKTIMRAIVEEHLPDTTATIEFSDGYPPMALSEGNQRLLKMLDAVSREFGLGAIEAVNPRNAGAADISYAAEYVPMAIDGVGLMGSGGHTVDEVADLRTLTQQAKRVAILMHRLAEQQ